MQLLKIKNSTTLSELSDTVGSNNIDSILATNMLKRTPNIGDSFNSLCNQIYSESKELSPYDKCSILNTITKDSDIFETVALQDDNGWKLMSKLKTLPGMLRIPDSINLPDSADILGDNVSVSSIIYTKTINSLKTTGEVDPSIFNTFSSTSKVNSVDVNRGSYNNVFQHFHIPWGQIILHSSIENESKDIPVYPEELSDSRVANYTQMPDMLYQYEPWQVYQSSGPRQGTYTFKIHRDMWTGNHEDGLANDLIRFCEANCYPEYNGSAVNTSIVTLYIAGKSFISGVLTSVNTNWSGPIGHDGWYLVCELELTFTEVSQEALDYHTVRKKGIIG